MLNCEQWTRITPCQSVGQVTVSITPPLPHGSLLLSVRPHFSGLYYIVLYVFGCLEQLWKSQLKLWQKLKFWQNLNPYNTQIVTKPKLWQNSSCDKTHIVTKLKLWQKSNCYKTQKLKMWQNSNGEKKVNNSKVTKLGLWQNLGTQIMTKLKNSNCDKT